MNKRVAVIGLYIILLALFVELGFYFMYVFKPFDRLAGKYVQTSDDLPSISELFTPIVINQHLIKSDDPKNFYSNRLDEFKNSLDSTIKDNSSFVKVAESNYIIAGDVAEVKSHDTTEIGVPIAFDITLKNSKGEEYIEKITSVEAQYLKIYLRKVLLNDYSRELISLGKIKTGDYLVIKRSTNLLNPSEINIEIEVLETGN